jgi:hypothetical protein
MIFADKLKLTIKDDGIIVTRILVDVYMRQTRTQLIISDDKKVLTEYDLNDILYIEASYTPKNFEPFKL